MYPLPFRVMMPKFLSGIHYIVDFLFLHTFFGIAQLVTTTGFPFNKMPSIFLACDNIRFVKRMPPVVVHSLIARYLNHSMASTSPFLPKSLCAAIAIFFLFILRQKNFCQIQKRKKTISPTVRLFTTKNGTQ